MFSGVIIMFEIFFGVHVRIHFLGPEVETGWHSGNDYSSGQVSTKKCTQTCMLLLILVYILPLCACRSSRPVSLVF